jgi:ketopantoate reductase
MSINTCSGAISLSRELENESAKFYQELSTKFEKDKDLFLTLAKENDKFVKQIERAYYGVITDAIEGAVWGKALANAAVNPLTALWRVPIGQLLTTPERRALLSALVDEAVAVAVAHGIKLPFDDPLARTEKMCQANAAAHSSMHQDFCYFGINAFQ